MAPYPITSPGSNWPVRPPAATAAPRRRGNGQSRTFKLVPVGTQTSGCLRVIFMWCLLPPNHVAYTPSVAGEEAKHGRKPPVATSPPLLLEASPKCMGRSQPCLEPRGAGKRRAATHVVVPRLSHGVGGHPDQVWCLCSFSFSRLVVFYAKGVTRPRARFSKNVIAGQPRAVARNKRYRTTRKVLRQWGSPPNPPPRAHKMGSGHHFAPSPSRPS